MFLAEYESLRRLESAVRRHVEMMGYSVKREDIQDALAELDSARSSASTSSVDANAYGEMLRSGLFVGPGYGCYESFSTRPDLAPVDKKSDFGRALLAGLLLSPGQTPLESSFEPEEVERSSLLANDLFFVAWFWDGDGMLLVGEHFDGKISRAAINFDCKKDYVWEWRF